ncbi:MAG: glucose 1-dehydrogenase [Gammaproteobacteria bacterium]|nr:glucose 1-dehydrogenase [Gammaproteobacteria bacterium]
MSKTQGRVEDKVAIVTGGAQGLGEAAVARLCAEGASVIVCDANATAGERTAHRHGASFLPLDVCQEAQWEAIIAQVLASYGKLDVLVNNAGIFSSCPIDEMTLQAFERVIAVNLTGSFLGCKHAVRAMKRNPEGVGGSIINLSSVTGLRGQVGGAAYASSKGGVRLLTKSVAMENARYQIRCNSVHPGIMQTPMFEAILDKVDGAPDALRTHIGDQTPLGRVGSAEDIGDMVLFLASDESRFVTGAEMVVDGGATAGLPY